MTHEIEQYTHHAAGESVSWVFTVEEDGSAKDLTSAAVEWYLLHARGDPTADALLDHDDADVTAAVTDAAAGEITVTVGAGATDGYGGDTLWHQLVVDVGSERQIWSGKFPVQQP